jgi:protein transport protein SEC24
VGPGTLAKREEASALGTPKENELLQPANNFYKNYAVECSRSQIGIDVFLFASQYIDVATFGLIPFFFFLFSFFYE